MIDLCGGSIASGLAGSDPERFGSWLGSLPDAEREAAAEAAIESWSGSDPRTAKHRPTEAECILAAEWTVATAARRLEKLSQMFFPMRGKKHEGEISYEESVLVLLSIADFKFTLEALLFV